MLPFAEVVTFILRLRQGGGSCILVTYRSPTTIAVRFDTKHSMRNHSSV